MLIHGCASHNLKMKQNKFVKKFVDFAIIDMTIDEKNQVSKYLMILL